jgi:hypothetical protein
MKISKHWIYLTTATIALVAMSVVAAAQSSGYEGRRTDVEYYGFFGFQAGTNHLAKNIADIDVHYNDVWRWGFGGSYFFTDQLSVLTELGFGNSDMRLSSTRNQGSFTQSSYYFNGKVNLEWTPFPTRLSPVVSGGIGFNNFQTAVPGAPPQVYCAPTVFYWWCGTGVPTYNQTAFSWNAGVGGRFDVTPTFFLKLMYFSNWSDYGGVGTVRTDQITLQLGGRFRTQP